MANNKSLVTSEALERMYNNLTNALSTMTEDAVDTMMNLSSNQVELKDASNEVKLANHYIGETTIEAMTFCEGSLLGLEITEATPYDVGDIVYIEGGSRTTPFHTTATLATGYYKCTQKKQVNGGAFYILISSASDNTLKSEYLGESYLV